jgi:hypothetical protein
VEFALQLFKSLTAERAETTSQRTLRKTTLGSEFPAFGRGILPEGGRALV